MKSAASNGISDWLLHNLAGFADYVASADNISRKAGVLQRIDPRIKIVGLLSLLLSVVFSRELAPMAGVFGVAVILAVSSGVRLVLIARWVWLPVLFFTGCIALPALFIVPGPAVAAIPYLDWQIKAQGIRSAAFLIALAESAVTLSALLALTTNWTHLIKALQVLRVPIVFVVILGSAYRYIFLLVQTASDMSDSRRSRTLGTFEASDRRRIAAATVGVLISKSLEMSSDVHMAMTSRGFRGELFVLDEFELRPFDGIWLVVFLSIAGFAFFYGH